MFVSLSNHKPRLSHDEYVTIMEIAHRTKMDCWFSLRITESQGEYCYDIENHKAISLRKGIKDLIDGLTETDLSAMSEQEKFTLIKLLGELI